MRATVSNEVTTVESVEILSTRMNRNKDTLVVRINKTIDEMSMRLWSKLFHEAKRIGEEHHPKLKEGWGLEFIEVIEE